MTVENCVFENCSGTALRCEGDSFVVETMTVRNSIFRNNSSVEAGAIGTNSYDGGVLIEGCLFESNQASFVGGAIYATITGPFTLRDNVFVSNRVEGAAFARGGALYLANNVGAQTVIEGNTFYGSYQSYPDGGSAIRGSDGAILRNNAFSNSSGAPALAASGPGYTEESCNLFWNNAAGDAVGFTPDATDVFADPEFCNPDAGDFTVSSTSPCAAGNSPPCAAQIGALGVGCGLVSIESTSWGRIKSRFRSAEE
jgi:predicted outer membrane repeat protein